MKRLPRLALAVPRETPSPCLASLALLAGLRQRGEQIQHFRDQAEPLRSDRACQASGLPGRHLDPWLMSQAACRESFLRGSRRADLAVVEGRFEPVEGGYGLRPLVETLTLPTVAIVPCPGLQSLHLPGLDPTVEGVILDGLERPEEYPELRRIVRLLTGRPVLGAVEALPAVRRLARRQSSDQLLSAEVLDRLARSFLEFADLPALRRLARSRPWPAGIEPAPPPPVARFRVAFASDEAFGRCFVDSMEMLEGLGAEMVEFSPLRSETLPRDVQMVMIGCGPAELYAEQLAANASLIGALKHLVCRGVRLYAEGGGAAYLGRSLILGERWVPGAGILPFDAVLQSGASAPTRVVRTLTRPSWLGPAGTELRGYCSSRWSLEPAPEPTDCPARSGGLTGERDLYFRHHAVGSLVHLNLASLPHARAILRSPELDPHTPVRTSPSET